MSVVIPIDDRFGRLTNALGDEHERHALEAMLLGYVRAQRWFGGQARDLARATFAAWLDLGVEADACLCIVDITDAAGNFRPLE